MTDREILDAINKAMADYNGGSFIPRPRPAALIKEGAAVLQKIIQQSSIADEADLSEVSQLRLDWPPEEDAMRFLPIMYDAGDFIFIGERHESGILGKNILSVSAWIKFFKAGGKAGPFIIVNPLSGKPSKKKSGDGETYRGDGCVARFQYCLGEFDNLSRAEQIAFWKVEVLCFNYLMISGRDSGILQR